MKKLIEENLNIVFKIEFSMLVGVFINLFFGKSYKN